MSLIRIIRLGLVASSAAMMMAAAPATAAALSLTGHESEARDLLNRYLSLTWTRARTIGQFKEQMPSNNPLFLAFAARFVGLMGELSNARHERFAQELEKTVPLRLVRCRLAPLRSELAVWGHATSGQRCRAPGTQADRCVTSVGNQRHRS
jgi:hypothetical protein